MTAMALIMLIRDEVRVMMESMWEEKMKWVSKVTLKLYSVFFPEIAEMKFLIFKFAGINIGTLY